MLDKSHIGIVHFIGIGGIGMSGIAELMHHLGVQVQGSDVSENNNVKRLKALGIPIFDSHHKSNIENAQTIVYSSAIGEDNIELQQARFQKMSILRRADMLAELMRFKTSIAIAGTHGKTTTTSLIAAILDEAGYDPTVINGGIINHYGTNSRKGNSAWMIVEADESDGSFTHLPADIVVVTNIDPEHLNHYGDFDSLKNAFLSFVENIPFDGFAVLCADHPHTRWLAQISSRRVLTYGLVKANSPFEADIRADNIRISENATEFELHASDQIMQVRLALLGVHNVQNALAAIALTHHLGIDWQIILSALRKFSGVARRFSAIGFYKGARVYDDYAHHPAEIKAVLATARDICAGKIIALAQIHRYSRLEDLFESFSESFGDADLVLLPPLYEAGETEGTKNIMDLAQSLRQKGKKVELAKSQDEVVSLLHLYVEKEDIVVAMGAGSISAWMKDIVDVVS